ncbi:Ig-like domain-containing protein [Nakamurella deserti]|uniref:Ig-like domain-containing protein n=1 Tax=Nakamurella deserti TaxID=2164074 RepID=UPI001478C845|nr:Ig-like domain-containing protein [Nakamurella deserti]
MRRTVIRRAAAAASLLLCLLGSVGAPAVAAAAPTAGGSSPSIEVLALQPLPPEPTVDGGPTLLTNVRTPTLTGTAPSDGVVTITVADRAYPVPVVDGVWALALTDPLADARYPVAVVASDGSRTLATLTVDTVPETLTLDGGPATYRLTADLMVSGTSGAPAGTTVTVEVADALLETVVGADGHWSLTPLPVADGDHPVIATVSDGAGNVTVVRQTVVVDTVAPTLSVDGAVPVLVATATPTLTGETDAAAVTVTVNGSRHPATVTDGVWAVTLPRLPDGDHAVTVAAPDPAGHVTEVPRRLTVDTTAPRLTLAAERQVRSPSPIVTGATDAPEGTAVTASVDGREFTGTVAADGSWTVALTAPTDAPADPAVWPDGRYVVTVTVSDPAGNTTGARQRLVVDTVAPTGTIAAPGVTSTRDVTLSGGTDLPAGSPVAVTVDDVPLTTTVSGGRWTVRTGDLADGLHPVVVRFVDAAGNETLVSDELTVDTVAPIVTPDGGLTGTTATPVIAGSTDAPAGSPVTVTIAGRAVTTIVGDDGRWSVVAPPFADGSHEVRVTVTDAAGNVTTVVRTLTVDVPADGSAEPVDEPEVGQPGDATGSGGPLDDSPFDDASGYDGPGYDGPDYDASGYDGLDYDGSGYDGLDYDGSGYDGSGYDGSDYDGPGGADGTPPLRSIPGGPGDLAYTGTDPATTLGAAAALTLFGSGFVLVARRRPGS